MQCKQLRHLQARDEKSERIDKARARVKDLHSRILVAIQRIDSISRKIEELRDNELQPQLEELVGGYLLIISLSPIPFVFNPVLHLFVPGKMILYVQEKVTVLSEKIIGY